MLKNHWTSYFSFCAFCHYSALGFPEEIHDELNQPDIKMLFELMMKVMTVISDILRLNRQTVIEGKKINFEHKMKYQTLSYY